MDTSPPAYPNQPRRPARWCQRRRHTPARRARPPAACPSRPHGSRTRLPVQLRKSRMRSTRQAWRTSTVQSLPPPLPKHTDGIGAFRPGILRFGYDGGGPYRCMCSSHGGGTGVASWFGEKVQKPPHVQPGYKQPARHKPDHRACRGPSSNHSTASQACPCASWPRIPAQNTWSKAGCLFVAAGPHRRHAPCPRSRGRRCRTSSAWSASGRRRRAASDSRCRSCPSWAASARRDATIRGTVSKPACRLSLLEQPPPAPQTAPPFRASSS